MASTLWIGSTGLVTPVGLSAPAACAAMRAGISRLGELPVANPLPQPIIGAYVPTGQATGLPRLVRLLTVAVRECIAKLDHAKLPDVPLLVAICDQERPDHQPVLHSHLIPLAARRLRTQFHPVHSRVFAQGRAGVLNALEAARRLLTDGEVQRCIVAGVDSLIGLDCRGWLYRQRRLKLEGNPDGLHPGEAAGALEIVSEASAAGGGRPVRITGLGFGREAATILGDEPNLAEGLSQAVKAALSESGIKLEEIDFRLSDVTGEQYYFRETVNAMLRTLRVRKPEFPLWHCADAIGDVGAAVGAVLLSIAAAAIRKGYAPGATALCQTSSDFGARAAAVVCGDT